MKLHARGTFLAAFCLAVLALAACNRSAGSAAARFPASNEVAGWVKTGETRMFSATELWSYIDGDVERYVKAGVQSTATSDHNFKNAFDTVVDIYTMADAKGARTIFDGEPAAQTKSAPLGEAARQSETSLVFCKGPYLVRLVAYRESPEGQAALQDLGRAIERRLSR